METKVSVLYQYARSLHYMNNDSALIYLHQYKGLVDSTNKKNILKQVEEAEQIYETEKVARQTLKAEEESKALQEPKHQTITAKTSQR